MSDGDTGKNHPIFHIENGVAVFDTQRINEIERKQKETENRDDTYKTNQLTVNRRMLSFTAVLAGCAVVAAGVTIWQACIANDTLTEIRNSKTDTQKLVKASEIQACAASRNAGAAAAFAISADGINRHTDDAVKQFTRLAGDSEKSIEANVAQSRLDQRAWISILPVKTQIETAIGRPNPKPIEIKYLSLLVKNTGKTPAIQASGRCIMVFRDPFSDVPDYDSEIVKSDMQRQLRSHRESAIPKFGAEAGASLYTTQALENTAFDFDQREQIVAPQGEATFSLRSISGIWPTSQMGAKRILYFVGEVTYLDVLTRSPHHTKFCLVESWLKGDQITLTVCDGHNSMD